MAGSLLVELLTEELPPKSLRRLSEAFADALLDGLREKGFAGDDSRAQPFATPRRLAVKVTGILRRQQNRIIERKGPAAGVALDAAGKPTPALQGFARSCGVDVKALERRAGEKGDYFVYRARQKGEPLKDHLAGLVEAGLKKLPVAKLMCWGTGDAQFVRPVHGLVMLHGTVVVPGKVLGVRSGRKTRGHRFLSRGEIAIARADLYEKILKKSGKVIADFHERREAIERQLRKAALMARPGAHVLLAEHERLAKTVSESASAAQEIIRRNYALLDEVTALVEWPKVYIGDFDPEFLKMPIPCLALSMQQHQRYFPLVHSQVSARMLPKFLMVSNNETRQPRQIIHGNERVLRARLDDARFFFEQDRKTRLENRVPRLANVVYHGKLGSQLDRVQRIQRNAAEIARMIGLDRDAAIHLGRAAYLCKADLLTEMVGEFPELQGVMGAYYARNDGEDEQVVQAIRDHYSPRFAGDALPGSLAGCCLALADKVDTLIGIFSAGQAPTSEKDPFGLRRQALGVVRILAEKGPSARGLRSLDVMELLQFARRQFSESAVAGDVAQDLYAFMLDRFRPYLRDLGFAPDEIEAVLCLGPRRLDQVLPRLQALQKFRRLPHAASLAAANKRIRNILRQARYAGTGEAVAELYREEAEKNLANAVNEQRLVLEPVLKEGDYALALKCLSGLRGVVDEFFDRVMVMVDDEAVRENRLALLNGLSKLFLEVADISRLQS